MSLDPGQLKNADAAFRDHLHEMIDDDPELGDIHDAFEKYCMEEERIGEEMESIHTGKKSDRGIDFYSKIENHFVIGQCKVPDEAWIDKHAGKAANMTQVGPNDLRNGLDYLLGEGKGLANERVKELRADIQRYLQSDGFHLRAVLYAYGALNTRAKQIINDIKVQFESDGRISVASLDYEAILDKFSLSQTTNKKTTLVLRAQKEKVLSGNDYCYFLANTLDIVDGYKKYGWNLFDLNVRYLIKNSPVNDAIIETVRHQKTRKFFHHYNNGITVTCRSYKKSPDGRITVNDAQIINGLQTVVSLYTAITDGYVTPDQLEKECWVQVKVIQSADPVFLDGIVLATNNQNPMQARNLKSNSIEQRLLAKSFSTLTPRWYYQRKQFEWKSLTTIQDRFFKSVTGYPKTEFLYKSGAKNIPRLIDNKEVAFSWLSFIGFSDEADKRTKDHFKDSNTYKLTFQKKPSDAYWEKFSQTTAKIKDRRQFLEDETASAIEYLFSYFLFNLVKKYILSPTIAKREALDRGVNKGELTKGSGKITSSSPNQQAYLASDSVFQTWRIMSNMKSVLIECIAFILAKRYGPLNKDRCRQLFEVPEAAIFYETASVDDIVGISRSGDDIENNRIFSRIMGFLHYAVTQFYEDKRTAIMAADRIRYVLVSDAMVESFKEEILEREKRKTLDKPWKSEGVSFLESLPDLPIQS